MRVGAVSLWFEIVTAEARAASSGRNQKNRREIKEPKKNQKLKMIFDFCVDKTSMHVQ